MRWSAIFQEAGALACRIKWVRDVFEVVFREAPHAPQIGSQTAEVEEAGRSENDVRPSVKIRKGRTGCPHYFKKYKARPVDLRARLALESGCGHQLNVIRAQQQGI
jgi:hypothetical protein